MKQGDSVKHWETLVTMMYSRSNQPVERIAMGTLAMMKRDCPQASTSIRKLSDTEYVTEHAHNGCGGYEGHRSVRKYIRGRDGIHVVAFDVKNRSYNAAEYQRWKRIITSSGLSD